MNFGIPTTSFSDPPRQPRDYQEGTPRAFQTAGIFVDILLRQWKEVPVTGTSDCHSQFSSCGIQARTVHRHWAEAHMAFRHFLTLITSVCIYKLFYTSDYLSLNNQLKRIVKSSYSSIFLKHRKSFNMCKTNDVYIHNFVILPFQFNSSKKLHLSVK